jgi:hypothetical protein
MIQQLAECQIGSVRSSVLACKQTQIRQPTASWKPDTEKGKPDF